MLQINKTTLIKVILSAAIFFTSYAAFSQDESIEVSTAEISESNNEQYKYFDIDEFEQSTIFKAYVNPNSFRIGFLGFEDFINSFAVEHKLKPSLSVELNGIYPRGDSDFRIYAFGGILRYYPSKRESSNSKIDRANNFTGNYLGLGYHRNILKSSFVESSDGFSQYSLYYGRQQKVGKWGFFDIRGNLTYTPELNTLSLGIGALGGLGYGLSKDASLGDLSADKLDAQGEIKGKYLFGLSNPNLILTENNIGFGTFSFIEISLGNYVSLIPAVGFSYRTGAAEGTFNTFFGSGSVELRKYLGIPKKISSGNVVSAFTGNYLSINLAYTKQISRFFYMDIENTFKANTISPSISYGWQQRAGKKAIFDFSFDLGYNSYIKEMTYGFGARIGILLKKN